MRINKSKAKKVTRRVVVLVLGIAYCLTLLDCYYNLISPVFAYAGLTIAILPGWVWIIAALLSLLPLLWMPFDFTRASDFASWLLYLGLVLPANFIAFMITNLPPAECVIFPVVLTASFLLFEFVRKEGRLFVIPSIRNSAVLFEVFLPIITIALSLATIAYANFHFDFSVEDMYLRRFEARNILEQTLAGYLNAFLGGVCIPFGVIYGLQKRKWHYVGMAVFAAAAMFSLQGAKGAFLSPFFLVIIYLLVAQNRISLGLKLLGIFVLLVTLSILEARFLDTSNLALLVVRRMLVVPAQLSTYYWEFFSQNPFVMMKDSILGWLIPVDANYSMDRARVIGLEYFSNSENNANASIWATGYADFGYYGMFGTSILAALTLKLIDSIATMKKFVPASVCCALIGLVWTQGSFYTSLLSNGVLMLIFALWLYPSQQSGETESVK